MTGDAKPSAQSALDDLAFMRTIVEDGGRSQQVTGLVFVAGGLAYGLQALLQGIEILGWVKWPAPLELPIGLSGTVGFLVALGIVLWRYRGAPKGGTAARAFNAAFSALGTTNLVFVFIVGVLAAKLKSFAVWELYPAAVFALQGAGWLFAFYLRRKLWHFGVAMGWFLTAAALGWWIAAPPYVLICGLGLLAWMVVPGWVLFRQGKAA